MTDALAIDWLVSLLGAGGGVQSTLLLGALMFLTTVTLVLLCIPGIILPLSIGSGALLGGWIGAVVVALGALAGSQLLFLLSGRVAREKVQARWGEHLNRFQRNFDTHGIWYVIVLRLMGTPNALVTASSAVLRMKPMTFAIATFLGMLPTIAIAAAGGSII